MLVSIIQILFIVLIIHIFLTRHSLLKLIIYCHRIIGLFIAYTHSTLYHPFITLCCAYTYSLSCYEPFIGWLPGTNTDPLSGLQVSVVTWTRRWASATRPWARRTGWLPRSSSASRRPTRTMTTAVTSGPWVSDGWGILG